jgi:cytoskeletal protein RodZ
MGEARQGPSAGGSEQGPRLGQKLRAAREAKGVSIEEVQLATGVPLNYLKMFEEGRFPMVSDPAYLAPFLRRYAVHLGLDPEQALRDLIAENEPETAARRSGKAGSLPEVSFRPAETRARENALPAAMPADRPRRDRGSRWIVYAAASVAAALVAAGGYMILGGSRQPWRMQLAQLRTASNAPVEAPHPPPAATSAPTVDRVPDASSPRPAVETAERPAAPVPVPSVAPTPATPEPSPSQPEARSLSPPYELSLTASSRPVWIWVSIDGGPRRSVLLDPGHSVTWVAQQGYLLSVDDAGAVRAVLNGTALKALGGESQARRNVWIPSPELLERGAIDDVG